MTNLLFLDIDGVLNGFTGPEGMLEPVSQEILDALIQVIEKHKIKIVFTSSQRKIRSLERLLEFNKIQCLAPYIHEHWKTPTDPHGNRGNEVTRWFSNELHEHFYYVCVDDDILDYKPVTQPVIKTDNDTGIDLFDIELIDILFKYLPMNKNLIKVNELPDLRKKLIKYASLKALHTLLHKDNFGKRFSSYKTRE